MLLSVDGETDSRRREVEENPRKVCPFTVEKSNDRRTKRRKDIRPVARTGREHRRSPVTYRLTDGFSRVLELRSRQIKPAILKIH